MNDEERDLGRAVRRLNARAWGMAGGLVLGFGLFAATNILLVRGADSGQPVGPTLELLRHFFPGYTMSVGGSLIGFVYAFVLGYIGGRAAGSVYDLRYDVRARGQGPLEQDGEARRVVRRLSGRIWGVAGGLILGLGLFGATNILLLRGAESGQPIGPTLAQLGYFFPGYSVSLTGSVIGFVYAAGLGYICGRSIVSMYNKLVEKFP